MSTSTEPRSPKQRWSLRITPLALLLTVLLLSAFLAALVAYFVGDQQRARFQREVATFDASLMRRLDSYVNVMVSTRALWSTGADIDRATFGRYVEDLDLPQRLPGAQSMGFGRWVPPALLSTYTQDQRRSVPDFNVHPLSPGTGGVKIPVTFSAPSSTIRSAVLGFDMYSESVRRAAIDQARLSNQPSVTAPLQLVNDQGRPDQPAVIFYLPVQRGGLLYGFVYVPVRMSDLLGSLDLERRGAPNLNLELQISDGSAPLYGTLSPGAVFQDTSKIEVGGRVWTVKHAAPADFGRDWAVAAPWLVMLAGTLVGIFSYLSFQAQVRARLRAEEVSRSLALSRSSLERARAEFEAIFRAMQDTAVFTDTNNLVLYANDALERQFGYAPHELRGQSIAALHADGRIDRSPSLERVTTAYRRRSGQLFYGEMQRSAVKGERGEVIGHLEVIHDITGRIDAERALKAGERRYRGVLEAVPYPLWVTDGGEIGSGAIDSGESGSSEIGNTDTGNGGAVEYRNAKYQQTFGEAMLRDVLHPQDRPALEAAWQESLSSGKPLQLELSLNVLGEFRYFVMVGAPILDAVGRVSEWVFSVSDIHDRLQAERRAVHNEERYRGVLEGMPQMVWLTDEEGQPTYFNRRWYDYVGRERAQSGFLAALHPDDRHEFSRRWMQALERRQPFEFEHRLLGAGGVYRTFMTRSVAIHGAAGQLPEWVGTSTDIDDQVYAEWSSRLVAAISGHLIGGEGQTPDSGVPGLRAALSLMNERFTSMSALWVRRNGGQLTSPISQVRGHVREVRLLSHPDVVRGAEQALLSADPMIVEGEALLESNLSGLLLLPLGGKRVGLTSLGGGDSPLLAFGFRQNVRDRDLELAQELASRLSVAFESAQLSRRVREAQEELRELNVSLEQRVKQRTAELEEANSELEAFSYSVSHDLRTPLRHIVGFADLLQKDPGSTVSVRGQRYMGIIGDAASRMGQLIDDLLEFSRMGRQEMRQGEVALSTLVAEVIAELRLSSPGREATWDISELPQVRGDASLLRQVLLNLLGNAAKYSAKSESPTITMRANRTGSETVLEVRDNGVGFDSRYADKLFGVFQRLHRADEFEGSGIGLANVRRIVTRHGGRVWAESELGTGAVFFVALPHLTENAAPAGAVAEEALGD
ncbi:PAS domain S-box protein [Deinococcus detaillensis]|uniref:histidine kinase n=1 Tax=Deinococcus detaillensis TaxID=2592048 RepID=A0A553UW75_9DEIO|nr:CHASE domain-containing protein [Deinococcus detaillensis]TSA84467.1 PAS domain S-box protein [Deinococcus detaillensis]